MNRFRKTDIYRMAPVWLQNAACTAAGWKIERYRFGGSFNDALEGYLAREQWSDAAIAAWRDARIARFVLHAYNNVPFYRAWFGDHGVRAAEIRHLEDLRAIPRLTKEIVRDAQDRGIFSFDVGYGGRPRGASMAHTSGTTGAGLRFPVSRDAVQAQWAVWWRYRLSHRLTPHTWCGYFGGRLVVTPKQSMPPFWRYNFTGRQILFSGYHLSTATVGHYAKTLRQHRPPWLHGYPSTLALLATLLLQSNEHLGYQPRWITLGAENVRDSQISVIERAFGVRPRQHYGMAEGVANASECPLGALHIDEDFAAVELSPNPRGGMSVLGTNFTNDLMPLIRYDTGDVARPALAGCRCGRPGRVLEALDGRSEDYVVLPSGAFVGRLDHIFKDLEAVREAQLIQRAPDSLTVCVVRASQYGMEDEARLRRELAAHLHNSLRIEIQYVDAIPRTANGKLRFVISNLTQPALASAQT